MPRFSTDGMALPLARFAGTLYLVAAALTLVTAGVPALAEGSEVPHLAIAGVGAAIGVFLLTRTAPLTPLQLHAIGLLATGLISLTIAATASAWEAYVPFYGWVALFYAILAGRTGFALQLAAVAVGLFLALGAAGSSSRTMLLATWWLTAVVGSAVLVFGLRRAFGRRLRHERDRLDLELREELVRRAEQEAVYTTLVGNIPGVVYRRETTHGWATTHIGRGIADITGHAAETFQSREVLFGDLIHPDDVARIEAVAAAAIAAREAFAVRYRIRAADGSLRWIEDSARPLELDGQVVLDGVLFDVTADVEAQQELERVNTEYRRLIEQLPLVTYVDELDANATTVYISPQIVGLLGYTEKEWTDNPDLWAELLHPDDREVAQAENTLHNATGRPFRLEYRLRSKDGQWRWLRDEAVVERDAAGTPVASRGYLVDITTQKSLEYELAHQAFHDALTGLANRALVIDRIDHALLRRQREEIALLYIDLDDFKAVNDADGHAAGDALLVAVAARLLETVRESDTVARMGGDEFVVLLETGGRRGAARAACDILDALRKPVLFADRSMSVSASIGLAASSPSSDSHALLQQADLAMYEAKRHGKGAVRAYSRTTHGRSADRLQTRAHLERAVSDAEARDRDHGLELFLQPIVQLRSEDVAGFEALVRWNHHERGRLLPGQFLPAIEGSALGRRLGCWVTEEAVRQVSDMRRSRHGATLFVTVNVTAHDLADDDFERFLLTLFDEHDVDPTALVLEITEDALIADLERVAHRLVSVRAAGVRVAIDDFGTGYSSLGYLGRLPADIVKIPKQMIDRLPGDARMTQVVDRLIDLCGDLGLVAVAEGIERPEQAVLLGRLGCPLGQGFLLGRPRPAGDVRSSVVTQRARRSFAFPARISAGVGRVSDCRPTS